MFSYTVGWGSSLKIQPCPLRELVGFLRKDCVVWDGPPHLKEYYKAHKPIKQVFACGMIF
jgi:hypothetical protein